MTDNNSPLKLICENDINGDFEIIIEQANNHLNASIKIKGPYIVTEKENANGRIYNSDVMEEAVEAYQKTYIAENRALGELEHPDSPEINFNNVCHKVLSLNKDKNVWIGESQVLLGVPKGDLLAGLLKNGVKAGISTRGVGNIISETRRVNKYKLIAPDVVANPSGPNCFVNGILESKSYMIDKYGDVVEFAYDKFKQQLCNLSKHSDEKNVQIIEAVKLFIKSI